MAHRHIRFRQGSPLNNRTQKLIKCLVNLTFSRAFIGHSTTFKACSRFVTTTESIRLVQTDGLGKPTVSETHSPGTDSERDTMPEGRK